MFLCEREKRGPNVKEFPVFNAENQEIGYLMLSNQLFYPYTLEGEVLPHAFFHKDHAVTYLQQWVEKISSKAS